MTRHSNVSLTQLRYFVEVAECLNMTKAAQNLVVAQSAVSTAIRLLERHIGADLFVRQKPRGLTLTAPGVRLLRGAKGILGYVDEVIESTQSEGTEIRGTIQIACFTTVAPFILPNVLAGLEVSHPGLEVTVLETDAQETLDVLHTGRAEIAITYDFGFSADIDCETVAEAPPYVLLPEGHVLAQSEQIRLEQLADEPMVLLDLPRSKDYFLQLLRDVGVHAHVRYRSASYETVRTLVARGHGFSILNQRPRYRSTYDGASVAQIPIVGSPQPPLRVVVARLAVARYTLRAQAVAAEVRRHFAKAGTEWPPGVDAAEPLFRSY